MRWLCDMREPCFRDGHDEDFNGSKRKLCQSGLSSRFLVVLLQFLSFIFSSDAVCENRLLCWHLKCIFCKDAFPCRRVSKISISPLVDVVFAGCTAHWQVVLQMKFATASDGNLPFCGEIISEQILMISGFPDFQRSGHWYFRAEGNQTKTYMTQLQNAFALNFVYNRLNGSGRSFCLLARNYLD